MNETILDIGAKMLLIRYAISMVIFLGIVPILFFASIKKLYKSILTILVVLLIGLFNVIPTLEFYGYKYVFEHRNIDKAIIVYKVLNNLPFLSNNQKEQYLHVIGACYAEKNDINNAILYYEKASENITYNLENETLANLYIINKDYDNAIKVGGKYKVCTLQNDWECVLKETTYRLDNAKSKSQPLGEADFIPNDESAFLYRAVAYKNLGDLNSAKKDYDMVLKLVPRKDLQ